MKQSDPAQRFSRAVQMLALAIAHILHGTPDSARTNLRACWSDLRHSLRGRLYHMATTAFVAAADGNYHYAARTISLTLDELYAHRMALPSDAYTWILNRCILSMERLPHARHMKHCVDLAYYWSDHGNYAEALNQLMLADQHRKYAPQLTPPNLIRAMEQAWNDTLEKLLTDTRASTIDVVRTFSQHYASSRH